MTEELSNYKVSDRQTFINFIELLKNNFLNNPGGWQNKNLQSFLEALVSYAEDIQGYYDNMNQKTDANVPCWQTFADIIKGATMYE